MSDRAQSRAAVRLLLCLGPCCLPRPELTVQRLNRECIRWHAHAVAPRFVLNVVETVVVCHLAIGQHHVA